MHEDTINQIERCLRGAQRAHQNFLNNVFAIVDLVEQETPVEGLSKDQEEILDQIYKACQEFRQRADASEKDVELIKKHAEKLLESLSIFG